SLEAAMYHPRLLRTFMLVIGIRLLTAAPGVTPKVMAQEPASDVALPRAASRKIEFRRDIQPIFAANCYSCHGPAKQKSDLRLDRKALALRGGAEGPVLVPGDSASSPLIQRVAGIDPDAVMPPKGDRLSTEQIATLRAWIDQGANWPDETVL